MSNYVLLAGVTGVGKTSLKGILIGERIATDIFESTLINNDIKKLIEVKKQDCYVIMFYIGLNTFDESINRVSKRADNSITGEDIIKEFNSRIEMLNKALPYCDEVIFYDNENGFVKVAEIKNKKFNYTNTYRPSWIQEYKRKISL